MNLLFPNFESELIEVNGVKIMARKGGSGRPLLLLHGHPQTHAIWHRVAQQLAKSHTVVMTDLRGYGDSSKPQGSHDHLNYSKRVMALDQIEVMPLTWKSVQPSSRLQSVALSHAAHECRQHRS